MGYLNQDAIEEWIDNCEDVKSEIGQKLKALVTNKIFDMNTYLKLFCVWDSNMLTQSRLAYYYGSKIIELLHKEKSMGEIFKMEYEELYPNVLKYFGIDNIC